MSFSGIQKAVSSKKKINGKRKWNGKSNLVTQAQLKRALKSVEPELKCADTSLIVTDVTDVLTSSSSQVCVNAIPIGDTFNSRTGRQIMLKSLRLTLNARLTWFAAPSTGDVLGNVLRCVVLWDPQANGDSFEDWNEIFGYVSPAGATTSSCLAPIQPTHMQRYRVLRDLKIPLNPTWFNGSGDSTNPSAMYHVVDEYIKLPNLTTTYVSSSTAVTSIESGRLIVAFLTQHNYAYSNVDLIAGSNARLRYTDA